MGPAEPDSKALVTSDNTALKSIIIKTLTCFILCTNMSRRSTHLVIFVKLTAKWIFKSKHEYPGMNSPESESLVWGNAKELGETWWMKSVSLY